MKIMDKNALKRIKKGEGSAYTDVMREVTILKKLRHENIVKLYEIIDDPSNDHLFLGKLKSFSFTNCIVMEFVEGGSIKTDQPLSFEKCHKYMHDVIRGLEYCNFYIQFFTNLVVHSQNIVHRDIKPENLLVSGLDIVKLSDFGVSHMFDASEDILKVTAGTPAFLAPEACIDMPFSGKTADIWAVGVTLFMMVYAAAPFSGDSYMEIYQSIIKKELQFPDETPPDLKDLLARLLGMKIFKI
jgi:serine/threonine protein kinase